MLRIAICDDDKRFTGELEKIIIKPKREMENFKCQYLSTKII